MKTDKKNGNLKVVTRERFFDVLYDLHCLQRGHAGVNKTEQQVKLRYYGFTRDVIKGFAKVI